VGFTLKSKERCVSCGCHISGEFWIGFMWLLLVTIVTGCTGFKVTGLYEPMSREEKKKVIEELKKNWKDYDVYCDGLISSPGAVIFDPKNDDRNLIGYRYNQLSKEANVITAIVWMESMVQYNPLLYRIFDEEKNFYGYVLIAHHLPAPRRVDQKTLQLPQFESMFYGGGTAGSN
jgi:hypothetical protein